jgi:hypothetical protein
MRASVKFKMIMIILIPLSILLNIASRSYPHFIEAYYSRGLNKFTIEFLNLVTGIFPFSVGELLILFLIMLFLYLITRLVTERKKENFPSILLSIAAYLSVLYMAFMFLWGFNYNRISFEKIAGLQIEKSTKQDLYELCNDLINRGNTLRGFVEENADGVMEIQESYGNIFRRAQKGYDRISEIYPQLDGKYAAPKPILISRWMSYTGITGVYMPYTGEANVNTNQPDFELLFTASHEMAHQRGFAREDEANYIAYLACTMNPEVDYQYSGVMLALINSMNALARIDFEAYSKLHNKYSSGLSRDIEYSRNFWKRYSGVVEKVSTEVNDKYLRSNGQDAGVNSYGMMVDLLLAEYKHKKKFLN